MSGKFKSQIYLEELQAKCFSQLNKPSPEFLEKAKETYPNFNDDLNALLNIELPSIYENPYFYPILLDLIEKVEKSGKVISFNKENPFSTHMRPVFGTLQSRKINTRVLKVPSADEFILVFEDQFFVFANLIGKIIALSLPIAKNDNGSLSFSLDKKEIYHFLNSHHEASERFNELIFAYIHYGQAQAAPQYFLDGNLMSFASLLRHSIELFVVGHEYSHLALRHAEKSTIRKSNVDSLEVNELFFDDEQEIEADLLGLMLLLSFDNDKALDIPLTYASVDLYYSILDVIEKSISIFRIGSVEENIKRSNMQRREFLRGSFTHFVVSSKGGNEALKCTEIFDYILQIHWRSITPLLYDAYKKERKSNRK